MEIIPKERPHKKGLSVIRMMFHQGGILSDWSLIRVVSHHVILLENCSPRKPRALVLSRHSGVVLSVLA